MARDTHSTQQRFIFSMVLTAFILVAELIVGLWTGSLALLSDAAHVFLDVLALATSFGALRLASRPADGRYTYGFHRFQVLAALVNGVTLLLVAFGIFSESRARLAAPTPVLGGPMLAVAIVGLIANLVTALVLRKHDHDDLNVRSAFLHVLGDALSSLGVIAAGITIVLTGWTLVDPLVSILIGVIILGGSGRLLREALHILAEGTPRGISAAQVSEVIGTMPGVTGVHDLHIWTVSPGYVALSAHVILADQPLAQAQDVQATLRQTLVERFGIRHTTVQLECSDCGQCAI